MLKYRDLSRLIVPVPSGGGWIVGDLSGFFSHLGLGVVSDIVISSFVTRINVGVRDTARFGWSEPGLASSGLLSLSVELEASEY